MFTRPQYLFPPHLIWKSESQDDNWGEVAPEDITNHFSDVATVHLLLGEGYYMTSWEISRATSSHLLTEAMEVFGGLTLSWIGRELNHLIRWRESCVRPVAYSSSPNLETPCHIPASHGFPLHHVQYSWGVSCHKEKLSQILGGNNSGIFKLERQRYNTMTVKFNKMTKFWREWGLPLYFSPWISQILRLFGSQ